MQKILFLISIMMLGTSCAHLHHVQIGQLDNSSGDVAIPFEIMVSEMGVSTEEAGKIANSMSKSGQSEAGDILKFISLFQIGPRTGVQVYNSRYAEKLVYEIHQKCPTGRVTGLMSIRETRKYPVISGEIVKITGFCLKSRKTSENKISNQKEET